MAILVTGRGGGGGNVDGMGGGGGKATVDDIVG